MWFGWLRGAFLELLVTPSNWVQQHQPTKLTSKRLRLRQPHGNPNLAADNPNHEDWDQASKCAENFGSGNATATLLGVKPPMPCSPPLLPSLLPPSSHPSPPLPSPSSPSPPQARNPAPYLSSRMRGGGGAYATFVRCFSAMNP